jgi:hypothetical protein
MDHIGVISFAIVVIASSHETRYTLAPRTTPGASMNPSDDWIPATFPRSIKSAKSEIRDGMYRILVQAGAEGVHWKKFRPLPWQNELTAETVKKALRELAAHKAYQLEYKGPSVEPTHWRLAP